MQFAPFRKTLYTIGKCSQEILPKALVDSAMAEFVSVSKGNGVVRYRNYGGQRETNYKNLYSSYKMTNPRGVRRVRKARIRISNWIIIEALLFATSAAVKL